MRGLIFTDAGCGYGASLRPLLHALETTTNHGKVDRVNLIDVDEGRLARALANAKALGLEARTFRYDIQSGRGELPESADIALFSMVILHLDSCRQAFALARRLVTPAGLLAVVDANYAEMRVGGDSALVELAEYIRRELHHHDQPQFDKVAAEHKFERIVASDEVWRFDAHGLPATEALSFVKFFKSPRARDLWSSIRGGWLEITYVQRLYSAA